MRDILQERMDMYAFLSRVYRVEVDESFMKQLDTFNWNMMAAEGDPLGDSFGRMGEYVRKRHSGTELALARDYMRCFFGAGLARGGGAYPYESVYTSPERLKEQDAMDQVLAIYAEEGLTKADSYLEPADQLGVELEFMAYLCEKTIEAINANNDDSTREYIEKQTSFLDAHLLNWVPRLCSDLNEVAEEDFYRAASAITAQFLYEDKHILDELNKALLPA